jgi:hypothetical protein
MERPHIHGDEVDCRAAVAAYIQRAEELLNEAVDVRSRVVAHYRFSQDSGVTGDHSGVTGDPFIIEDEWGRDLRGWFEDARGTMGKYLQEQLQEVLPIIEFGLPRTTGTPTYATALDRNEPWLRRALDELRDFQTALSVSR